MKVTRFPKESRKVGTKHVDEMRKFLAAGICNHVIDVVLDGRKTMTTQLFGDPGSNQFLFARMQTNAAVVIYHFTDLSELLFVQRDCSWQKHRFVLHALSSR